MPTRAQIVSFAESEPPPGESPWVPGAGPSPEVEVVDPDPTWPARYDELAARIRGALGWRVLSLEHVGSTAVAQLAAKPVIDVDLVLADPDDEAAYVPSLEAIGFELRVREPWWCGHRVLRQDPEAGAGPRCHLHVFRPDSPEPLRHRLFTDWLRAHPDECDLYARTKREAAAAAKAAGEHSMLYNARKQAVVREIYGRAFRAAGLVD